ncbi:Bicarbonate transporter BicA [bioreactor metagenome]|uniref:Bicarbonate transporter BicA n=1 Tax=bioreactor metagenome TaxID=1076179 RepID=A0A644U3J3_9ZZZZ|nr:SulP family inorganic anion transporter [Methanocorpusculum sp.]
MNVKKIKDEWFSNIRGDTLSGITVALALIPEAIAFSIIAGVDPMVGLYASFCIAVIISITGGRPGMISAATGSMALVMVVLVRDFGLEYLLAATVLTGIIQFVLGLLKVGRFISFIPYSVVLGFVNSLAILIFLAQLPFLIGAPVAVFVMAAATIGIIWVLPRFTKAVPAPLVAIVVMTAVVIITGLNILSVGDLGTITRALPVFHLPMVPLNLETLLIILPYSVTLVIIGILESLLTASIVDEMTGTVSSKDREVKGQGIANVVAGFFGGMAGCAMIGQSMININSGGKGRLSSMVAGLFLMFLILVLGDVVAQIPMAALVGVMIMVAVGTFEWQSVKNILKIPKSDALIMIITIAIVVYTHDLAKGVLTGVVIAALVMVYRMSVLSLSGAIREDGVKVYTVKGQLFFGTMSAFIDHFDYKNDPSKIEIDFQHSHIWDQSAVEAIARVIDKYQREGCSVYVTGLDDESQKTLDKGFS